MERTKRKTTIADQVAEKLAEIASMFQDDVAVSLVVRSLNSPDGSRDCVVTDDPDLIEAQSTLAKLWRDPSQGHGLTEAIHRQLIQ